MTPQRYEQINALADAAMAMAAERRAAFLDTACSGDDDLRARVELLIQAESSGDDFLESPAMDLLAKDIAASRPARDLAGQSIGRYGVISRLGAGGIGEVWLAWDEQLHRQIALKLLSPGFAGDPNHVRRFQQEARSASGLNHPNIVTIHDIGKIEGVDFIAQEFVKGQTLRQQIENGPLALPAAIQIGVQVAAALQAAHGAGIVHRDIKPENIMVRPDGLVKVLDFGLATFTEQAQLSGRHTLQDLSRPGLVLGTVKYMSPEQARGLPVDARSDIFSLGIVLYEIGTGVAPFSGATPSDTMAAILEHEPPPLLEGPAAASADFERIIRRCLRKDRKERYSSAQELRAELTRLAGGSDSQLEKFAGGNTLLESSRQFTSRQRKWLLALAALLLLSLAALAFRTWNNRDLSEVRFNSMKMSRPPTRGNLGDAAISADGKYLAYIVSESGGQSVWLTQRATATDLRTVAPEFGQHSGLTFSPDGAWLYSLRTTADGNHTLYRIPVLGGEPAKILDDVSGPISFGRSGRQFAFVRLNPLSGESAIEVVNTDGAEAHRVAVRRRPAYFSYRGLAWSPDEQSIACFAGNATSYTKEAFHLLAVDVFSGRERSLTTETWAWVDSVVWLTTGGALLVNASERTEYGSQIWRVSLPGGKITRVTNDVERYARLSVTSDARTLAVLQTGDSADLWVSQPGGAATQITFGTVRNLGSIAWTPDGRILYSAQAGEFRELWIMDPGGGNPRQLTASPGDKINVVATGDRRFLVYQSEGKLWRVDANGRNPVQLTHGSWDVHPSLLADGKSVVYASFSDWSPEIGGKPALWEVPVSGGESVRITQESTSLPKVSPDGKRLACVCFPGGDPRFSPKHMCAYDLEAAPPRKIFDKLLPAESEVWWSPNGAGLDYNMVDSGAGNIWRQPLDGSSPIQITHFTLGGLFYFARSNDGARLGMVRGSHSSDLVLITGFQ